MFGYSKEAVRVKVKKCEGKLQPELRKFSVDPQITSLEVLQSILIKAFDIKSDFSLSYRTIDDYGQEIYLPLLSDWELDAAFLKAHNVAVMQKSEPCVQLKVDMKPFAEASEDWEPPLINSTSPILPPNREQSNAITIQQTEKQEIQTGFQGLFMNQVEKTFNMVSRALNLYEDPDIPPRPPLSDIEFRSFLDTAGQITNTSKLKEVIYCGGIDPSLRKVVWKHILNVYPDKMTGKERMDFIKKKANEYYMLKTRWKDCVQKGMVNAELSYVTSMVRKDVLRTDRHHNFYAGSDDNQNIASLFNILTTYALNHPTVSYCQGMSDLASPLLVTMGDEAHAYICLCALMSRLYPNFLLDGEAMTLKFSHLTESLQVYDPEFYNYLKMQQADDLLFCYRWLLLEMKREFAFDDALIMLEVLWASLPQKTQNTELSLIEKEFDPTIESENGDPPPLSPLIKTPRENAYTKVCAIRRQSSSFSLANNKTPKLSTSNQFNCSLDEKSTELTTEDVSSQLCIEIQSSSNDILKVHNVEKIDENSIESIIAKAQITNNRVIKNCRQANSRESGIPMLSSANLTNAQENKETPLGNQIRMLRDKISVHNNKFFTSLEKLDSGTDTSDSDKNAKVKMVKNLNEFLNLATVTKSGTAKREKLERAKSVIVKTSPKDGPDFTFSKTSFDENDLTAHKIYKDIKALNRNTKIYSEPNDGSSPDDSQEYYPMTTSMTRELRLELEHLDRQVFGQSYVNRRSVNCESPSDSTSTEEKSLAPRDDKLNEIQTNNLNSESSIRIVRKSPLPDAVRSSARSVEDIYLWENPLHRNTPTAKTSTSRPRTPDEQADLDFDIDNGEIFEERSGMKSITPIRLLRKNFSFEPRATTETDRSNGSDASDVDNLEIRNRAIQDGTETNRENNCNVSRSHKFFSSMSQELENAKRSCESLLNSKQSANLQSVAATINNFQKKYDVAKPQGSRGAAPACGGVACPGSGAAGLPPPAVFGGGNPFLMFLCLTVLLQHRDYIMRNRMDYNELAMHFDKMVRKHNVNRVLNQARQMYAVYLKQQPFKTDLAT